jgi:Swt1-like HEPN
MTQEEKIKLFALSNQIVESELDHIEERYAIELGRKQSTNEDREDEYYPQFQISIRNEAQAMAEYYELFYCLEKTIRNLVREKLESEKGPEWWEECVPSNIRDNAKNNIQREIDSGVTLRSKEEIDYTTFGELGEIVKNNWSFFGDVCNSQKAFSRVMTSLNILRGPIAHCSFMATDEVNRLHLTLRDWFRLME